MNSLLSYKDIPFNAGDGYILVRGEENLEIIEALLVAREINNLTGRFDILLINEPILFLQKYYQPVQNSPEEESKIISINPSLRELKSSDIPLNELYETYKKISPIFKNAVGYERDIHSRIELLILRNLGMDLDFLLELAERSEEKGVLFYKNNIVNALKEFLLLF